MTRYQPEFYIGVDLGQRRDPTAIAVVERYQVRLGWDPVYVCDAYEWRSAVRLLEQLPLGTPYPEVVERVKSMVRQAAQQGRVTLVVDATGVGRTGNTRRGRGAGGTCRSSSWWWDSSSSFRRGRY